MPHDGKGSTCRNSDQQQTVWPAATQHSAMQKASLCGGEGAAAPTIELGGVLLQRGRERGNRGFKVPQVVLQLLTGQCRIRAWTTHK